MNFLNKPTSDLVEFLLAYEKLSGEKAKELQKCLIQEISKGYLGSGEIRKKYYNKAAQKENISEGNLMFDARLIHISKTQLKDVLNQLGAHGSTIFIDYFLSDITTDRLKSTFSLLHMKDKKNLGIFVLDDDAINALPPKTRSHIIPLLQKRCNIGNHDRFHNLSFGTLQKALNETEYRSIKKIIADEINRLQWKYSKITIPLIIKYSLLRRILENLTVKVDNNPDIYVKTKKLRHNYTVNPQRKKIDIPDTMGGGRKKKYSMLSGAEPQAALYEYLSILIHFRTLQLIYEEYPNIKENIIQETKKYLTTIKNLHIDQEYKDYWIASYLLFTSRIIDFKEIPIEEKLDNIPKVYHAGEMDLYEINQTLVQDNQRMDQGYTVT